MSTRSARTLAMLAVLGAAASLGGCGTTLDMAAINKSVSEGITSQLSLPVESTTCPTEARAAKAGDTFECILSSGTWYILLSGLNYTTSLSKNWGGAGYLAVPAYP